MIEYMYVSNHDSRNNGPLPIKEGHLFQLSEMF